MPPSKHRCICKLAFCQDSGGEATVRVPVVNRHVWLTALGLGGAPCTSKDPRISIAHFAADDIEASIEGLCASVVVRPARDANPTQSSSDMADAAQGAFVRLLRVQAENKRLTALWMEASSAKQQLAAKVSNLQHLVKELESNKRAKTEDDVQPSRRNVIDYHILSRLKDETARSLCGIRSVASLEHLYDFINEEGIADNLVWYRGAETLVGGVKPDGSRPAQRKKELSGLNGLFFTLFVLRTASSLRVTSTLFGVSESTGGRAFTTWVNFLRKALAPCVRLPDIEEVERHAPDNFIKKGLSKVAVVIDATESRVDKVWQSDAARATWSNYKGTSTGKVLIAITPGGAICHISQVYGGRVTDEELVVESGIIEGLIDMGICGKGFHVMADRGFNTIARRLMLEHKIHYVAPPSKRRDEPQFNPQDANITRDVANLRIHVERAIGAMKQWRILDKKFDSQQFDLMGSCYDICGALVNLVHEPFKSKT